MQNKFHQSLRVLGLEPGASEQAIKEAYRDLVKVWHPDRFGSDPRLRAKAQDKLAEVNAAFEHLRGYRPHDHRPPVEAPPPVAPQSVPRPTVGRTKRQGPTPAFIVLTALAASVGVWLFMSGRERSEITSPTNETIQHPVPGPARVPVAPPVERPAAEAPASSADDKPEQDPVPATGSLIVSSRPTGARISFDGEVVGETPLRLRGIVPGEYEIALDLTGMGYEVWSGSVVVTAGREEKVLAVMTRKDPR